MPRKLLLWLCGTRERIFIMARPASVHPTDGELEILHVLWNNGPTGLSVVCETLRQDRDVATTTVATMLKVMLDKGLVKRQGAGRSARWSAVVTHENAAGGLVGKLVDRVFDGAADRLAAHLVEGGQLSNKQLSELRKLIDQRARPTRAKKGAKR
jgi:BlaI family penicillinase repressor